MSLVEKLPDGTYHDPVCNADGVATITIEDIESAKKVLEGKVVLTPCKRSRLSEQVGMEVYLKKEFEQFTGSFKERGACNAISKLSDEQKARGVVTASLGNHAQGVSYHGMLLNVPVTVIMPVMAPLMKIKNCRNLKANVIVEGNDMGEAKAIAMKMSQEKGLAFINAFDHPDVIAGQGTIALEIFEQMGCAPDCICVPVGGGGLICGIAIAAKAKYPECQIIGFESEKCASFTNAMQNKKPTLTVAEPTLADGLSVPVVGYNSYGLASKLIKKVIVCKEECIAHAILRLLEAEKCVVEGAGATGLSAILAGDLDEFKGKKVCLVCSGGNIDTTLLGRCLERGLAADGRLMKFKIMLSDRPGSLRDLCTLICDVGCSIKKIMHADSWLKADIFTAQVEMVVETRDLGHSEELRTKLLEQYPDIDFYDHPLAIEGVDHYAEAVKNDHICARKRNY